MLAPTAAGNWALTSHADTVTEKAYDAKLGAHVRRLIKPYADWWAIRERLQGKPSRPIFFRDYHLSTVINQLNNISTYNEIISSPIDLKNELYEYLGATYNKPVPSQRLPVRMT